jgi:hypothetical protein
MNTNFLAIVKQIAAEQGEGILGDAARLGAFIKKYALAVPQPLRIAFGRAIEEGAYNALKSALSAAERASRKAAIAQTLRNNYGVDPALCAEALDTLEAALFAAEKPLCAACGKELKEGWMGCPFCGAASGVNATTAPPPPQYQAPPPPFQPPAPAESETKDNTIIKYAGITALVFLARLLIFNLVSDIATPIQNYIAVAICSAIGGAVGGNMRRNMRGTAVRFVYTRVFTAISAITGFLFGFYTLASTDLNFHIGTFLSGALLGGAAVGAVAGFIVDIVDMVKRGQKS